MNKSNGQNKFEGNKFNGTTNIAGRDVIINSPQVEKEHQTAQYDPEPIWRSPLTLAILTWISVIVGIVGIFPLYKVVQPIFDLFRGVRQPLQNYDNQIYCIIWITTMLIFIFFLSLRRITKKETRHPLFLNHAISGKGKRITIEKVHIRECPICGGKMKYYNKPVEWREILRNDGSIKKEVTKKIPVLECKRNHEHCYPVDPAEERV